jgi:cholesterol oxidase
MLDVRPVEPDPRTGELPLKTRLMEDAATRLGRRAQFFAVRFEGAGEPPTPNKFGALQSGCLHCGECDIGNGSESPNGSPSPADSPPSPTPMWRRVRARTSIGQASRV